MSSVLKSKALRLALLCLAAVALLSCNSSQKAQTPVIFIMLDTLRADHLGFYGYERDTSPNLDAFAKENVAFKYAFTASPWTPPSVATMLTGVYPRSHGHMPPNDRDTAKNSSHRLAASLETLPEVLKQHGYATAGVSPNPWISPTFGFDQGFDTFNFVRREDAKGVVNRGIKAIDGFLKNKNDPFFLYLHFLDVHDPYDPPDQYRQLFRGPLQKVDFQYNDRMQRDMGLYDGEIRYLDDQLGRFFSFLKERGIYDRALIVIVADHGEQFGEHGASRHGNALHNEEVHIPLLIRAPKQGAQVVEQVVSNVDVFPTILDRLGITAPPNQRDGLSLFDNDSLAKRAGVFSEIHRVSDQRGFISKNKRKVIFEIPLLTEKDEEKRAQMWEKPQLVGLFDIPSDYLERRPLEDRLILARLQAEVQTAFKSAPKVRGENTVPAGEVSDDMLDQLKSLGYLQ